MAKGTGRSTRQMGIDEVRTWICTMLLLPVRSRRRRRSPLLLPVRSRRRRRRSPLKLGFGQEPTPIYTGVPHRAIQATGRNGDRRPCSACHGSRDLNSSARTVLNPGNSDSIGPHLIACTLGQLLPPHLAVQRWANNEP
jgi:hypothetical protein